MDPAPRLACQQCKQRKLRCDKGSPCSSCRAAGLACQSVQRARLPRGKSGSKQTQKKSLETSLKQLEALLDQGTKAAVVGSTCTEQSKPQPDHSQFLALDFWSSLAESISGVREILDDSSDEHEGLLEIHAEPKFGPGETASVGVNLVFPNMQSHDMEFPSSPPAISEKLFELFRDRVDTVYKVVHLPTALARIRLAYSTGAQTANILALEYAMYFMAVCTIDDYEAEVAGLGSRSELLRSYRVATEGFLASSNLLSHPDLHTLQALVIYMIGLRTCLNNATTWTLVAVAARIATALRLGDEDPAKLTFLELDARRRTLYAIGVLDTHAALDRGTIPILPSSAFQTPPLDINDSYSSPEGGEGALSGPAITDMTHSMMTYHAMLCQRKMYDLGRFGANTWTERKQLVMDFGTHVDELAERINRSLVPVHVLIVTSGRKIHRSLELLLRRPPYRQSNGSVPLSDDFDIMLAATEVLELHLEVPSSELKPWAWKNWVQWHALAVLLAELLTRLSDPLSTRAFEVASGAYRYYARIVADSQSGLLWKPIARLMRRVHDAKHRGSILSQGHDTSKSGLGIVSEYAFSEESSSNDIRSFDCSIQSVHDQSAERDKSVFNAPRSDSDNPHLIWDEFLEDIIDLSAWC